MPNERAARMTIRHIGVSTRRWIRRFVRIFKATQVDGAPARVNWSRPDGSMVTCFWASRNETQVSIAPPSEAGDDLVVACSSVWIDIAKGFRLWRFSRLQSASIVEIASDKTLAKGSLRYRDLIDAVPGIAAGIAGLALVLTKAATLPVEVPVLASGLAYLVVLYFRRRKIQWEATI